MHTCLVQTVGRGATKGAPITQVSTKAWYAALERAGIVDFRWHDLRHVWATWHVQNGTPLFALQELGGWESPEMVRRYAHLAADHLAPYAQRLGTVRAVGAKNDGTNTAQKWRRVRCCYLAEARREWCC